MKNYEHGELAKEVLMGLASAGLLVACVAMPGLTKVIPLFNTRNTQERSRINRTLKNLQERKLVKIYQKGAIDVIEITNAGKRRVLQYNLDDMKLKVPKKWDGWWRIVMFDIPQSKKKARDAVSRKIKELGLYPIQKSVFVAPYLCKNEIDFIGEFFNVRDHIIYVQAKEIEGVRKLKQHFNIS
ncbi:MAG: hypothetical protein Q7K40_00180 [bacterium]|nr:hypothetical protein [bacterium]